VASELLIVGTSGLAREAAQLARQMDPTGSRWQLISFVAKDDSQLGQRLGYGEVRLTDAMLQDRTGPIEVVIGIGHPQVRRLIAQRLEAQPQMTFPNLIHPSVDIDTTCISLGHGNIVTKGVVMTCDIVIGDFNLFNWNTTIGHDVRIGSCNVINPGCNLSGFVELGDDCLLGTGTQVLEHRRISSGIVVGAGAVVTRSLTQVGTYVGIPARGLRC
jgi:sugar O-acyltransferase (sialic acid O-acetyltransferase NeuD family)